MNEKQYNNLINEGGEGYNPFAAAREQEQLKNLRPLSSAEQVSRLRRYLDTLDCAGARESGAYDAAEVANVMARLERAEAQERSEFLAVWTVELTIARRAEWNHAVQAGAFGRKVVDWSAVRAWEAKKGWITAELKRAVQIHKL